MCCVNMKGYGGMVMLGVVMMLCFTSVHAECNDNPAASLSYEIDEGLNQGTVVARISEQLPPELGPTYGRSFFLDAEISNTFNIDYNTGIIKTKIKLDRETKSKYEFDIEKGASIICIKVTVLDINEFAPEFSNSIRTLEIYEGAPKHRASTLGSVIDKDAGENSIKGFQYDSESVDYAFNVSGRMSSSSSSSGEKLLLDLNVNGSLDYETTTHYTLLVEVFDGGSPSLTSTMTIDINILDKNDNHPIFNQSKYFAAILENSTVGTSVLEVHATDQDSGSNGDVTYSIDRQSDPEECFIINPQTGVIRLNKPLDFETISKYKIFAIASDGGSQSNLVSAFIEIEVLNVNEVPADIFITYLVDDNPPRIPENASVGSVVARVSVSDPEAQEPDSSNITVTLRGGEGQFRLDKTRNQTQGSGYTFLLRVNKTLDREIRDIYNLTLTAADTGTPPLSAYKSFLLRLTDINDNSPVFSQSNYEPFVDEMSEPGSSVLYVSASDQDVGENARISYSIKHITGGNSDWFHVDSISGLVTTRGQVDCEVNSHPSFWLVATDQGIPSRSSSASVVVSVSDINDKEPTFDQSLYQASIPENKAVGSCILQVNATDPDCGVNGQIRYSIVTSEVSGWFTVEPYTGNICINQALDYEDYAIYQFAVVATDSGNFTTTANVEVVLQDINDNAPEFYPRNYSMNIQDSSQPGSTIITVQASDADSGDYGVITYSIKSGNSDQKFEINGETGTISVKSSLPAGEREYRLVIDATDGGDRLAQQPAEVYISVTGPDSNPPIFTQRVYRFEVSESLPDDSFVGMVLATYAGSSDDINYTISTGDKNSFFKIDPVTGIITTARELDHDEHPFLVLGVQAKIGRTPLFGSTQVNISVLDENDNAPHFSNMHLTASVSENANSAVTIYSAYASDKDSRENGVVRYYLKRNPDNLFTIDAISGEIHLQTSSTLDYEIATQHELVIEARDQGQPIQSSSMTLMVNVQDANDNPPVFSRPNFQLVISEKAAISEKIGRIVATDVDSGENGRISFSLIDSSVSSMFGIFPSDGNIYLKNLLDREMIDKYTFKVRARDHGQPSLSGTTQVTVYVEDYNDNAPAFMQSEYHFYIEENQPSQKLVGAVIAYDLDDGNNAVLQFDINNDNNDFDISNEGYIHTKRSLDRELHPEYNVEVTVRDLGNPSLQASVSVLITVTDINDHAPVIQNTQFMEQVDENKSKGVRIVQIVAKDPDAGDNGTISFTLAADDDPNTLNYFAIHPSSGWITTKEVLDYEEKNKYTFQVVATDLGSPSRSTYQRFEIRVNDMNDEGPVFTKSANETFYVVENTPIGTTVGNVEAYDRDGGENGRVSYYIIGGNRFGLFSVALETGVITTVRDIDYEEYSSDDVTIKAVDNSVYNPKSSIITIKIHVIDVNDNTPIFEKDPVFLTVRENIPISTVIHKFTATDADSGVNGTVRYEIMKASVEGKFEIDPTLGKLSVNSLIDYEEVRSIDLVIKAIDQAPTATSRLFTTVTVYILVKDENDNAPVFHSYQPINLREDEPVGYRVMSVIAADADGNVNRSGNNNVTYSITNGNINGTFSIGYSSGVLAIASPLDREAVRSYTLLIRARDHGTPYLESELAFVVHITDVNDNDPKFLQSVYHADIIEHSLVGTPVTRVSAIDDDDGENGLLTYQISDGISQQYFHIDPVTGFITLATNDLDREQASSHTLTVYVQDSGSPTLYDTAIVNIDVTDINDSAPKFKDSLYLASIPENQTQEDIHTFVAYDADIGDNAVVTYSISDGSFRGRFMINAETGLLTTREALDRESVPYYILTIKATDGQYSDTCRINITVIDQNDNDPVFEQNKYEKLLYENAVLESSVVTVKATDSDEGNNGRVTYSLHNDSDASLFEIDPTTGEITTKGVFDREKKSKYTFEAIASDEGLYDRRSVKVRVEVTIGDINDNAPVFQEMPYKKNVEQGLNAGQTVLTVRADDKDAGVNGEVTYTLSTQSDSTSRKYFEIGTTSGAITARLALGTEALGYHNLKVIATDKAQNALSSTGVVEITVGSAGGNTLQFSNQNYSTSLHENANVGSRVISVELKNQPSIVTFSFASGNHQDAFYIDASGLITVLNSGPIDYEAYTYMRLIVSAVSGETYAYTTVWVNLIDVNDNKPKFSQDKYVTKVYEAQPRDTYVMQVTATDADSHDPNSDIIYYNIIQGNIDEAFIIDPPKSGIIKTNVFVDYEIRQQYRLTIEAKDNGSNKTLSSTCVVKISVIDVNDNPPTLPTPKPVYISESTDVGSVITMVTANDIDVSPPVMYNFSADGNPNNMFSIDHYSGMIRLSKQLDYEKRQNYVVGIQASDTKYKADTNLEIYVVDENDHAPTFSKQSYQVSLAELTPADTSVIKVNATDLDAGENSRITYSLATSLTDSFYIHEHTGIIYTKDTVMYQANQEIIQLVVKATDNGTFPLSAVVAVYIQISSVNNYAPEFVKESYVASVSEDTKRGFVVLHVEANDRDTAGRNREIDYRIIHGNVDNTFMIDQKGGRIMLNGVLDRERDQGAEYNLLVMASDRGLKPRNSTVNVQIIIQDVNDRIPYFQPGNCDNGEYCKILNESFPDDVGFLKVSALDDDIGANSKIYYTITSGNDEGLFIVNGATGELFITPNVTLDYERHTYHKLIVKALDCSGCPAQIPRFSNFTTVHINITDVNEYDPEFPVSSYFEGVMENMAIGSSVFKVHANDKDGGEFGIVEYVVDTSEFSIQPSGYITTNNVYDYESASKREFQFTVTATDKGGRSTTVPVFLHLEDVDEYDPQFKDMDYTFEIPGSAKKGNFIGRVSAVDQDGGSAGKVVYQLAVPHNYFGVNASTGVLRVTHDLNRERAESSRKKREVNNVIIVASSGLQGSRNTSVVVGIDVDRTCAECGIIKEPLTAGASMNVVIIVVVLVSVIAVVLLVIIIIILVRRRNHGKTPPPSETPMCDNDEFDSLPHPNTNGPPVYGDVIRYQGKYGGNVTTSSDMSAHSHHSGSSGRGSAEDEEDEELAMINSSSPNYLNNSNGFRKNMPDSGIQDDDNTSEPSVQNHQDYLARLGIDTAKINSKAKSGLTHSVESMHQFSDSGGGEGDGLEIDTVDYTKLQGSHTQQETMMDKNNDMGFHEPEPHMGGSLSNVINSEEEYSGSYNWDYLLDWGPQYQPLAHVFSEIARLKDDTLQPKKQAVQIVPQRQLSANAQQQVRMVPPPMITNAPPKAITQPVSRSNRSSHSSNMNSRNSTINTSLPSMPRSPISHESSFTSPALTPSFTPSLSPLATRSPSVSPVNSGRGMVSNHSSGQTTPRSRNLNLNNNNKFVFSSSSSEQELRI